MASFIGVVILLNIGYKFEFAASQSVQGAKREYIYTLVKIF